MISVGVLCAELDIEDDGTLPDLIRRATEFVQQQTGRYFGEPREETVYLEGTGKARLWLPDVPAHDEYGQYLEPAVVYERRHPGDTPYDLELGVEYEIRVRGVEAQLVRIDGYSWKREYEYEVTYTVGYEVDTGPGDVRQAVIDLCSLKLQQKGSEGIRSESLGQDYQYTYFASGDLDAVPAARAVIELWRRPVAV